MSVSQITIQLKTMSGDLFPLEVVPSASLEEIAQKASATHPEPFPSGRTKVLSMEEDRKEHEEGDVLLVVVADGPTMEKGRYPEGGQPYVRWSITLREMPYYLYISSWWKRPASAVYPRYAIGVTTEVTKPSETHDAPSTCLYEIITRVVPDITPKEMKALREIVEPYLQETSEKTGQRIERYINPDERIECECGSVIKYSGVKAHEKTKKHLTWWRSLPAKP